MDEDAAVDESPPTSPSYGDGDREPEQPRLRPGQPHVAASGRRAVHGDGFQMVRGRHRAGLEGRRVPGASVSRWR